MPFEFDPVNKYIKILSGTGSPLSALTIYNAVMDWADSQEAIVYSAPMGAVGKAPLGGGVYTDSIFVLQDGWKIKLYNGTYQFVITGTVITDNGTARTVPPDSGNVEIVFQVSSQGIIATDLTLADDLAKVRKIEGGRWKIQNNQMIFYDSDNTTPLLTFNLLDKAGQPSETNVYERVPV